MGVLQRELLFPYYTRKCKAEDLMITFYTRVQDVIHLEHTTITHNAHTYVWTDHAPHSAKENKWRRKKIAPLLLWCTIFFSLLFSSESAPLHGGRYDTVRLCVNVRRVFACKLRTLRTYLPPTHKSHWENGWIDARRIPRKSDVIPQIEKNRCLWGESSPQAKQVSMLPPPSTHLFICVIVFCFLPLNVTAMRRWRKDVTLCLLALILNRIDSHDIVHSTIYPWVMWCEMTLRRDDDRPNGTSGHMPLA